MFVNCHIVVKGSHIATLLSNVCQLPHYLHSLTSETVDAMENDNEIFVLHKINYVSLIYMSYFQIFSSLIYHGYKICTLMTDIPHICQLKHRSEQHLAFAGLSVFSNESDWLIRQFTHPYFRGGYTRGNNNITAG